MFTFCHDLIARLPAPWFHALAEKPGAYAAVGLGSILSMAGCAPPIPEGFDSPDPTMRLIAITEAGRTKDKNAIPDLIEQLESTDPAARMLAIRSLEQITGETFGYDCTAHHWERADAIACWREWAEANSLSASPAESDLED